MEAKKWRQLLRSPSLHCLCNALERREEKCPAAEGLDRFPILEVLETRVFSKTLISSRRKKVHTHTAGFRSRAFSRTLGQTPPKHLALAQPILQSYTCFGFIFSDSAANNLTY
jgi:hypothetical protein